MGLRRQPKFRSDHGGGWAGMLLGASGTFALHVLFFAPLILGAGTHRHRTPPDQQGAGASAFASRSESTDTMILMDLSGVREDDNAAALEPASQGTLTLDLPIKIASPDPIPAFASLAFEEAPADEKSPTPEAAGDAVGHALLFGRYVGQVSARIERAWVRPRAAIGAPLFECQVRIEQDRSGGVLSVELMQCNGDTRWQESLVFAIERASPLSAPPDPSVFANQLLLSFSSPAYLAGVSREDEFESPDIQLASQHR